MRNGFQKTRIGLLTLVSLAVLSSVAQAQRFTGLEFLGQATFPGNNPVQVGGTNVGGLSGIDFDAANNRYFINSDAPTNPRFYTATLNIDGGVFDNSDVTFTGVTSLTNAGGVAFPANTFDFEAIRYLPGSDTVLIPDEGNALAGIAPSIREFNATTGQQVRQIISPSKFNPTATTGPYFNLSYESLTLTNGGSTILTGTENGLRQDTGNVANPSLTPQLARLVTFDSVTGTAGAEFAYPVDAVFEQPQPGNFAVQGLVELLSLGGDDYLSIERSFTVGGASTGTGYAIRLYQFSLAGATDVRNIDPLNGGVTPITKTLLFDLGALGTPLDNIEGVTLGPTLEDGRRTLVLVSDDNFGAAQFTQFLVFASASAPEPSSLALIALTCLGVVIRRRVR